MQFGETSAFPVYEPWLSPAGSQGIKNKMVP